LRGLDFSLIDVLVGRSAANHAARSGSRPSSGEAESASEIGKGEPYEMTELSVEAINNKEKNMPTINERPRKNAPSTWQATVRVKGQPSVSHTFDTREEAERFGLEAEKSLRSKATRQAREHSALRKANPALADFMQETLGQILPLLIANPIRPYLKVVAGDALVSSLSRQNQSSGLFPSHHANHRRMRSLKMNGEPISKRSFFN